MNMYPSFVPQLQTVKNLDHKTINSIMWKIKNQVQIFG